MRPCWISIGKAYAVSADTVLGGPNWLARTRFDIVAKAPDGTSNETLQLMLQSLLADRFKLVLHKDTKPVPAFVLTVSGAPKLKAGTAPADDDAKKQPCQSVPNAPQTSSGVPFQVLSCHGMTMEQLAAQLPNYAGAYITTRVIDQTGLKGYWDFDLKWTGRGALTRAGSEGITMPAALEALGLKVGYDKAPAPVLVVDSANDTPTPNPSGTAENLPAPPPAEFDVADIKVAAADAQQSFRIQPGGRIDLQGLTMKDLFGLAWEVNDDQLVANAPKWFDTTKVQPRGEVFSRSAMTRTAASRSTLTTPEPCSGRCSSNGSRSRRTSSSVRLTPTRSSSRDKPKLQPADPANRTNRFEGVLPASRTRAKRIPR